MFSARSGRRLETQAPTRDDILRGEKLRHRNSRSVNSRLGLTRFGTPMLSTASRHPIVYLVKAQRKMEATTDVLSYAVLVHLQHAQQRTGDGLRPFVRESPEVV
jgi:hypothetical protein